MNRIVERINDYLTNGGLFNPELMDHEKVRNLLLDSRSEIQRIQKDKDELARIFRQMDLEKYPETYFISGTLGKFQPGEMPPQVMVIPSYGSDVTYVYEKTEKVMVHGW